MCQVHTGAYVSLVAPGKTNIPGRYRVPPRKDHHVYISRINSTYHYAYARLTQVNWKKKQKENKKRKERKGEKREEKKRKRKWKGKKNDNKKSKKRRDKKGSQERKKREKKSY